MVTMSVPFWSKSNSLLRKQSNIASLLLDISCSKKMWFKWCKIVSYDPLWHLPTTYGDKTPPVL